MSNTPLPPHEERRLFPRGIPTDPQEILEKRLSLFDLRARFFGYKSVLLIRNLLPLNQPVLCGIATFLYFVIAIMGALCACIFFIMLYSLTTGRSYSIPIMIISFLVMLLPALSPNIFASMQQGFYQRWIRNYEEVRRKYFEGQATT